MTHLKANDEIEKQAKYWLFRIEQGLSLQERQAFVAWSNQDNKHHSALHKYSRSLSTSKLLTDFNGLFPLEKKSTTQSEKLFSKLSLAACVTFFCVMTSELLLTNGLSPFFQDTPSKIVYQQFSTETGEQASFSLPDGSLVQLNTNSLLTISFSEEHRQLNLIKGEALFDVAKDKLRPFSVSSGQQSFTALGTIFNIQKSENDHLELLVTEGRVLIADLNETLPVLTKKIALTTKQPNAKNIIVAGEIATIINKNKLSVNKISPQVIEQELAWQKGMVIFDGQSLTDALDEISRYSQVKFTIEDPELASMKVSGRFKAGDIETLLGSLSYNFDLEYKQTNNNTIIINKVAQAGIESADSVNTL